MLLLQMYYGARKLPNWLLASERQLEHGQAELGRGQAAAHTRGLLNDGG